MTTITIDRATVEQALEALEMSRRFVYADNRPQCDDAITALRAALAQEQTEPDLSRCPRCNGPADNGFDRSIPPSPYLCTKCMAEPVAPVAWECKVGGLKPLTQRQHDAQTAATKRHYTRIAPPQRKPLTEEEIDRIDACIDKFIPLREGKRLFARAIERAVWEKNNG